MGRSRWSETQARLNAHILRLTNRFKVLHDEKEYHVMTRGSGELSVSVD
jgi:hypothetical protein